MGIVSVEAAKGKSMSELPKWPNPDEYLNAFNGDRAGYQHARAKAALARLKVAVDALREIKEQHYFDEDGILVRMVTGTWLSERAEEALSSIDMPGDSV